MKAKSFTRASRIKTMSSAAAKFQPLRHTAAYVSAALALTISPLFISPTALAEDWLHTARPGDTIASICAELTKVPYCAKTLPTHNPQLQSNVAELPQGSQIKIPVAWLQAPPVPADVELVRGEAFFERRIHHGGTINLELQEDGSNLRSGVLKITRLPLVAGAQLKMGDRIITEDGNVLLRFADDSSFLVKSNSELVLERLSAHGETGMVDTHMRLQKGSGRARVNSRNGKTRYQISTPAAIAAARGTDFSISASPQENGSDSILRNEVLEGQVSVSSTSGSAQLVNQGFGTVAESGKAAIEPVKLLPAASLKLNEQTGLPFTLDWRAVKNAEAYTVEVFSGADGSGSLLRNLSVEDSTADINDLDPGAYTFVVRAVDHLGLRGMEALASTTANVDLESPRIERKHIKTEGEKVHFEWPAVKFAEQYHLEISATPEFNEVLKKASSNEPSFSLDLPSGTTYYARVQAEYPKYGASAYSESLAFGEPPEERSLWLIILQGLGILAVAT